MRSAIVVLNWNCAKDTTELVLALSLELRSKVVIVDNGSDLLSRELEVMAPILPTIADLVANDRNLGYAGGMNAGVRRAKELGFDSVILLNADARPTSGNLEKVEFCLSSFDIVGIQQSAFRSLEKPYTVAARRKGIGFLPIVCPGCERGVHNVDLVSGALLAIRVQTWSILGGLDERYFHYKEEVDFCLRAGKAGARIGWICASTMFHERGGSLSQDSPAASYYRARNEILYYRWNCPQRQVWFASPKLWATEAAHARRAFATSNGRSFFRGVLDGLKELSGPLEDRV